MDDDDASKSAAYLRFATFSLFGRHHKKKFLRCFLFGLLYYYILNFVCLLILLTLASSDVGGGGE